MGFCSLAELRLCSEHVLTVHVWELVLLQALSVYDPIEPRNNPLGLALLFVFRPESAGGPPPCSRPHL